MIAGETMPDPLPLINVIRSALAQIYRTVDHCQTQPSNHALPSMLLRKDPPEVKAIKPRANPKTGLVPGLDILNILNNNLDRCRGCSSSGAATKNCNQCITLLEGELARSGGG